MFHMFKELPWGLRGGQLLEDNHRGMDMRRLTYKHYSKRETTAKHTRKKEAKEIQVEPKLC